MLSTFLGLFKKKTNYRVIYPDGQISMPMRKDIAEDYAKMFGGKIVPTNDPIYHLGLK